MIYFRKLRNERSFERGSGHKLAKYRAVKSPGDRANSRDLWIDKFEAGERGKKKVRNSSNFEERERKKVGSEITDVQELEREKMEK